MRFVSVFIGFFFLSLPVLAKAPFKSISFAFQDANTLGFQINYHPGHGTFANSILRFNELEVMTYSNFVANETVEVCTKNLGQISCSFNFQSLLPKCAYTSEVLCDRSAASEIHNLKLSFTLVLETEDKPHNFSGTIHSDDGQVFLLENKDFRSVLH